METFFAAGNAGNKEKAKECIIKSEWEEMKKRMKESDLIDMNSTSDEETTTNQHREYTINSVKKDGNTAIVDTTWTDKDGKHNMEWVLKQLNGQWKISMQSTFKRQMKKAFDKGFGSGQ
jgi:hypothetical protein